MNVEEDGDEIFTDLRTTMHCGQHIAVSDGFWKCRVCRCSFGRDFTTGALTTIAPENHQ